MTGETLKITPHESVTVRERSAERLEVEVEYGLGGKPPPPHYHPEQDERFEVLAGELTTVVDGSERVLRAGETLSVPRGQVHKMWNASGAPTRCVWVTTPAGRTYEWFSAIDSIYSAGRKPGPLDFGTLLSEYDDVFRLAVGPEPVVKAGLSVLGAVGRRRGRG